MLRLRIDGGEIFNDATNEFISIEPMTLMLEHSLVSISKWESKWKVPFLGEQKTDEQGLDYIRCMTMTQNVNPNVYLVLTPAHIKQVSEYIEDAMSATKFYDFRRQVGRREVITSEKIYYWMVAYNIPFECQKWHLNRLLNLIQICDIENSNNNKSNNMSTNEVMAQNRELNAARRAAMRSKG